MPRRLFTIQTKKIATDFVKSSYVLVNKFGIHHIKRENNIDSGLGFCYRYMKNKSFSFDDYKKNNKFDNEYNEIMQYIKEKRISYDASKKRKYILNYIIMHFH